MKSLYLLFIMLFIVPPTAPKQKPQRPIVIERNDIEAKKHYISALDSAIIKERRRHLVLRKKSVERIQLLVQTYGNDQLEKDFYRYASH